MPKRSIKEILRTLPRSATKREWERVWLALREARDLMIEVEKPTEKPLYEKLNDVEALLKKWDQK